MRRDAAVGRVGVRSALRTLAFVAPHSRTAHQRRFRSAAAVAKLWRLQVSSRGVGRRTGAQLSSGTICAARERVKASPSLPSLQSAAKH